MLFGSLKGLIWQMSSHECLKMNTIKPTYYCFRLFHKYRANGNIKTFQDAHGNFKCHAMNISSSPICLTDLLEFIFSHFFLHFYVCPAILRPFIQYLS